MKPLLLAYAGDPNLEVVDTTTLVPTFAGAGHGTVLAPRFDQLMLCEAIRHALIVRMRNCAAGCFVTYQ